MLDGQWPEPDRVCELEDRGARPQAERQRQYRDGSEAGRFAQITDRVADVLPRSVDDRLPADVADSILHRSSAANL